MARPTSIRDEDLMLAARHVLLEKGIRATTAEVAARAGVSEGILFKRFGSKAGLFRAAMRLDAEMDSLLEDLREAASLSGREALECLGLKMVARFRTIVPIAMMAMSAHTTVDEMPEELRGADPHPLRATREVSAFLEAKMRAGEMRTANATVLARAFLGSLWHFVFLEMTFAHLPAAQSLATPSATFVRDLVDVLWSGVAPTSPPATNAPAGDVE